MDTKGIAFRITHLPLVGNRLFDGYMRLRHGAGRKSKIRGGPLKGLPIYRFVHTVGPHFEAGTHEYNTQQAMMRWLRPNQRVFDIGANGGFFSLLASKLVGQGGQVVAFEPHPRTCYELKAQLKLNSTDNVTVVRAAVSDVAGTVRFTDTSSLMTEHLLGVDSSDSRAHSIVVSAVTLDEQAAIHGDPDLIKIDVEGAENLVLRGGAQLLARRKPTLLVELHSRSVAEQFYELLDPIGYRFEDHVGVPVENREYERFITATADAPREDSTSRGAGSM